MSLDHHLVARNGTWYVAVTYLRKRYLRSTGFPVAAAGPQERKKNLSNARRWRDGFMRKLREGRLEDIEASRMSAPVRYATLGELFAAYLKAVPLIGSPTVRTANRNVQACRKIIRDVKPGFVDSRSTEVLTPELLEAWAEMVIDPVKHDREAADSARRSVRSYIRQARSLFKRSITRSYKSLPLPDLTEYLRVIPCGDPSIIRQDYMPEEVAILETRPDNDGLYLVWLLGYNLALRAGEMAAARWSWFVESKGQREMHICDRPAEGFYAKGFSGWAPVHEDVWTSLQALRRDDDEYILPGDSPTARHDLVNRDFSRWMRKQGWTRRHCSHELRAYRGDKWRDKYGADVCQDWMRHASIETQRHYVTRHTIRPAIK